jgi:hypothetical protein
VGDAPGLVEGAVQVNVRIPKSANTGELRIDAVFGDPTVAVFAAPGVTVWAE